MVEQNKDPFTEEEANAAILAATIVASRLEQSLHREHLADRVNADFASLNYSLPPPDADFIENYYTLADTATEIAVQAERWRRGSFIFAVRMLNICQHLYEADGWD